MEADLRLDHQLCFSLYAASRAATGVYREALADVGLTYPQYLVMLALWERDGLGVGELGEQLLLDSGTLSPLLKRLEAVGLVSRSRAEGDSRRVVVHLTDAGHAMRATAERIQCSLLEKLEMSPDEAVLLHQLATRLTDSIRSGDDARQRAIPTH